MVADGPIGTLRSVYSSSETKDATLLSQRGKRCLVEDLPLTPLGAHRTIEAADSRLAGG